jgi:hypothetical protein
LDNIVKTKSRTGDVALCIDEFLRFFHSLTYRPELDTIIESFSADHVALMDAKDLQRFLTIEQKFHSVDLQTAEQLIMKYADPGNAQCLLMGQIGNN